MNAVKPFVPDDELHVTLLIGLMFRRVQQTFAAEDWRGLRQSHFRVLFMVPAEGINITELSERVGMTKQGCGQFVQWLTDVGYLRTEPDPADRRSRLVRRTPRGDRMVRAVVTRNGAIEDEWRAQVGPRRYQTFRRVLEELALGGPQQE